MYSDLYCGVRAAFEKVLIEFIADCGNWSWILISLRWHLKIVLIPEGDLLLMLEPARTPEPHPMLAEPFSVILFKRSWALRFEGS